MTARTTTINVSATLGLLALLVGCGGGEQATVPQAQPAEETHASIGDHTVHFSAQLTNAIPPEIARAYNIVRSKNRAMLTVSVIDNETDLPVTADVTVKTQNLTGQLKNVVVREIREPGDIVAIYYIGETAVANRETLIFDISVIPDGKTTPRTVRFQRQFYTD